MVFEEELLIAIEAAEGGRPGSTPVRRSESVSATGEINVSPESSNEMKPRSKR